MHRALLVGSVADGIHQLPSYLSEIKILTRRRKKDRGGREDFSVVAG